MGDASYRLDLLRRAEGAVADGLFDAAERYLDALRDRVLSGPVRVDLDSIPPEERQVRTSRWCDHCELRTLHVCRSAGDMTCAQHHVWTDEGWAIRQRADAQER